MNENPHVEAEETYFYVIHDRVVCGHIHGAVSRQMTATQAATENKQLEKRMCVGRWLPDSQVPRKGPQVHKYNLVR